MNRIHTCGFTLVELLVVITIIVTLLSLLAPAMDRAIYQAELAVCGTQLKAIGSGAILYAMDHKRSYFYREAVRQAGVGFYRPRNLSVPFNTSQTANLNGYDDRPVMSPYLKIDSLQCPPAGKLSLADAPRDSYIYASYSLWIGWKYDLNGQDATNNPRASTGMYKMGDRLGWDGRSYSVLAGDVIDVDWNVMSNAHPESNNFLAMRTQQARPEAVGGELRQNPQETSTLSDWYGNMANGVVGRFDWNFLYDDGAVARLANARWNTGTGKPNGDPRVAYVPPYKDYTYSIIGTLTIPKQ